MSKIMMKTLTQMPEKTMCNMGYLEVSEMKERESEMKQVGFIGLGAMGMGMARNLAQAGQLSWVWNRSIEKSQALAQAFDVSIAASIEDLASHVDCIVLCVSADEDVLQVVQSLFKTVKAGTVVIDCSTVSRESAQIAAELLTEKQAYFLDAPVSGGVEGANKGCLSMMVGGDKVILAQVRSILDCFCQRIIYMGATGSGQATKAVNQIMAAGINQAVTEALAFASAENLPIEKVIEVVSNGAAGNWFLEHRGLTMTQGKYATGFKLELHHKDLKICQAMANNNGVDVAVVEKTLKNYAELMQQGKGEEDISALYRLKVENK